MSQSWSILLFTGFLALSPDLVDGGCLIKCLKAKSNICYYICVFNQSPPISVDITVYHNGYHGDLNETFFVGEVDEGAKRLVQTTYECLMQAIDAGKN